MIKHTQKIRRLLPTNCLSVFDHFVGLVLKGLRADQNLSVVRASKPEYYLTVKHYIFRKENVR